MKLEELIEKFLDRTNYHNDDKILAIVFYGSRVKRTNKEASDLDVMIITNQNHSSKVAMVIEGIKVDCNIFSAKELFDFVYDKWLANNAYFNSVLKNGLIIKNNGILEELEDYLLELEYMNQGKKKLSLRFLEEIKDMYDNFKMNKKDFWYFNLLEKLRMAYNYLKNCSYVSMVKTYDIFSNADFYRDVYNLIIPDQSFIDLFLSAIECDDYDIRLTIIDSILNTLGIDISREVEVDASDTFYNDDDIKNQLLIIYNKKEKVLEFLENGHPYVYYTYCVLLRQMDLFYQQIYRCSSKDIDEAIRNSNSSSAQSKIETIKKLFGIVEADYHFDYNNYVLKLMI